MSKANLEMSPTRDKSCYSSDSHSSASGSDVDATRPKARTTRRRRKKKKIPKKPQVMEQFDFSDSEMQLKKSTERCISVLELLPETRPRSQSWHRKTTILKSTYESRRTTTHQLAEVQAKLISLRNKLWYGIEGPEVGGPLSCGDSSFRACHASTPQLPIKAHKVEREKPQKKKEPKPPKERKLAKRSKNPAFKDKDKPPKKEKQTGFKRQTTIEWVSLNNMTDKIKKLRTLTDTSSKFRKLTKTDSKQETTATVNKCESFEKQEESKQKHNPNKKKKKKKMGKLGKTAKTVTNATIFIKKD